MKWRILAGIESTYIASPSGQDISAEGKMPMHIHYVSYDQGSEAIQEEVTAKKHKKSWSVLGG
jgi:urease alpha subunit